MEWLLELMGYIRNIAYQSTSVQNVTLDEVQSRGVTCGSRTFVLPKDQKVAACLFPPPSFYFWATLVRTLCCHRERDVLAWLLETPTAALRKIFSTE